MLSLLLLSLAAPQQAEAAPAQPAAEAEALVALRKHASAVAEAKSYAFTVTTETSGMPGFGRGGDARGDRPGRGRGEQTGDRPGRGGQEGEGRGRGQGGAEGDAAGGADDAARSEAEEDAAAQPWTGVWQQGKPVLLKRGEIHAARDGRRLAMKRGEGDWQHVSFGRRERGGRSGFQRGPGGFDRELARPAMEVLALSLPHETLATLLDAFDAEKLEQENALGLTVFLGPLSPEGALRLATGGRGAGGRRGGEGPTMDAEGRARVAFAPDGRVIKIEIRTKLTGSFGERSFERSQARTMRAEKIGAAEAEIPTAAIVALEEPEVGDEF